MPSSAIPASAIAVRGLVNWASRPHSTVSTAMLVLVLIDQAVSTLAWRSVSVLSYR